MRFCSEPNSRSRVIVAVPVSQKRRTVAVRELLARSSDPAQSIQPLSSAKSIESSVSDHCRSRRRTRCRDRGIVVGRPDHGKRVGRLRKSCWHCGFGRGGTDCRPRRAQRKPLSIVAVNSPAWLSRRLPRVLPPARPATAVAARLCVAGAGPAAGLWCGTSPVAGSAGNSDDCSGQCCSRVGATRPTVGSCSTECAGSR